MVKVRPEQRKSLRAGRAASARSQRAVKKGMTCEAALRAIARSCIADLRRDGEAAGGGDVNALHRMRIALTQLRTAIRFFAPALNDAGWIPVQEDAAWLSRQAGAARDVDVALERQHRRGGAERETERWRKERDRLYATLRRSLRSQRFGRFIDTLSGRSKPPGRHSAGDLLAGDFSAERLDRWRRKLLKQGRKLDRLGKSKRHRLRLRAKRFRYALEWSLPLLDDGHARQHDEIRQAKAIQDALGPLNDACTHRAQARALKIAPLPSMLRLAREKSERRHLKTANRAFTRLARLQEG